MSRRSPLFSLYLTRLREFYRQPARIFWVYGFPTFLALGLGLAFSGKGPSAIRIEVVKTPENESLKETVEAFNVKARALKQSTILLHEVASGDAERLIKSGKATLIVERSADGLVKYRFDPTRPEAAAARSKLDSVLQEAAGRVDPLKTADVIIDEPGSRYIDFLIPGLIGQNTMGGGLWGVGFLLVNFRIGKLLKRFQATPMPRRDFLMAILGARLTFLIPDVAVLLALGAFVFDMPIRGSLWLIGLVAVVGALAFAGIGLLIASRASTTETVSGLMNLVMLPMWIGSGLFFPAETFPDAVQPLVQSLPLTQLLNALRAVVLEGAGLLDRPVWLGLLILSAWAGGTFLLALKRFKWS